MSVTWMRIRFDHLQYTGTFIVLSSINVRLYFLFVALRGMIKNLLTLVHWATRE